MQYLLLGAVLPERAQCSIGKQSLKFQDILDGTSHVAEIEIILNRITITVTTDKEWKIEDLRNVARNIALNITNILGYMHGIGWDVDISQIINRELDINYVFGAWVDGVSSLQEDTNFEAEFSRIKMLTVGDEGLFISKAFHDLNMAIRSPTETAFYCYRSIENLRQIIAKKNPEMGKAQQWEKLREITQFSLQDLEKLIEASKAERHGEINLLDGVKRVEFMSLAWSIINSFLKSSFVSRQAQAS